MRYVVDSVVKVGANSAPLSPISLEPKNVEIIVNYVPTEVPINTPFTVEYDGWNRENNTLILFGYIIKAGASQAEPGSYWTATVEPNMVYSGDYLFQGIPAPYSGQIVVGHIEDILCEDITDPTECINANCYWYNGACHTSPAGVPINWMIAVPIVAVVGIGLIVGIAIRKKK